MAVAAAAGVEAVEKVMVGGDTAKGRGLRHLRAEAEAAAGWVMEGRRRERAAGGHTYAPRGAEDLFNASPLTLAGMAPVGVGAGRGRWESTLVGRPCSVSCKRCLGTACMPANAWNPGSACMLDGVRHLGMACTPATAPLLVMAFMPAEAWLLEIMALRYEEVRVTESGGRRRRRTRGAEQSPGVRPMAPGRLHTTRRYVAQRRVMCRQL